MEVFAFTKPGRAWNEDRFFISQDFCFVLDGATSLTKERYSEFNTDAEWVSDWWKEYLIENLKDMEVTIPEILKQGVKECRKVYNAVLYHRKMWTRGKKRGYNILVNLWKIIL